MRKEKNKEAKGSKKAASPAPVETPNAVTTLKSDTFIERIERWATTQTLTPMPIGTACCSFEYIAASSPKYQVDRFMPTVIQVDPSESDLMMISGPITPKILPYLKNLYDSMPEPKWVISLGACTNCGGLFQGPNVIKNISEHIPIDLYIAGCPPTAESIIDGVIALKGLIKEKSWQ